MGKNTSPERELRLRGKDAGSLTDVVQARAAVRSVSIAQLSLLAAAVSILAAAGIGYVQLAEARKQALDLEARNIFADYLKVALDNPDLSDGPKPALSKSPEDRQAIDLRYDWYTAYAFTAFERIAVTQHDDAGWRCVLARHLFVHRDWVSAQLDSTLFSKAYNTELYNIAVTMRAATPAAFKTTAGVEKPEPSAEAFEAASGVVCDAAIQMGDASLPVVTPNEGGSNASK